MCTQKHKQMYVYTQTHSKESTYPYVLYVCDSSTDTLREIGGAKWAGHEPTSSTAPSLVSLVVTTTSCTGHLMVVLLIPPSLPEQELLSSRSELLESTSMITSVSHSASKMVGSRWVRFG